jgi:hypothetical protein
VRTTLTLDPDVVALLERVRQMRHLSVKEAVNEAMRRGFAQMTRPEKRPKQPFRTRSVQLGDCLLPDIDDVAEALAVAEQESFR